MTEIKLVKDGKWNELVSARNINRFNRYWILNDINRLWKKYIILTLWNIMNTIKTTLPLDLSVDIYWPF